MEKKLDQGDGVWDTKKEILGWIFDGVSKCISLPKDKVSKISDALRLATRQGHLTFKNFEKLVGKLRHASIGIPAG